MSRVAPGSDIRFHSSRTSRIVLILLAWAAAGLLLVLPLVGFVDGDDPMMLGTLEAVEQDLMRDGFLLRYRTQSGVDGVPGDEHPFLACSFWLVSAYAAAGRRDDAHALFDKLVALVNDVGLLSEEYDPGTGRMAGNFPQAFSHLTLVQAALALR